MSLRSIAKTIIFLSICSFRFSPNANLKSIPNKFPAYPDSSDNNIHFSIPEVRELAFVALSVSEIGMSDQFMINKHTSYYQEVQNHFSPYITTTLNELLSEELVRYFDQMMMDATLYSFDELGNIQKKKSHNNLSWEKKDHFEKFVPMLQSFAQHSNFRSFYNEHHLYYQETIQKLNGRSSVSTSWEWLKHEFYTNIHDIQIVISPLSYGRHSTNLITEKENSTCWIFVSASPEYQDEMTDTEKTVHSARMIFTELDHQFVNPASDKHSSKIKKLFRKRETWVNKKIQTGYPSEYAVFNEYMTWALFLIYAKENFPESDYQTIQSTISDQMIHRRGFIRFEEFNMELQKIRSSHPDKKMEDCYPMLFEQLRRY